MSKRRGPGSRAEGTYERVRETFDPVRELTAAATVKSAAAAADEDALQGGLETKEFEAGSPTTTSTFTVREGQATGSSEGSVIPNFVEGPCKGGSKVASTSPIVIEGLGPEKVLGGLTTPIVLESQSTRKFEQGSATPIVSKDLTPAGLNAVSASSAAPEGLQAAGLGTDSAASIVQTGGVTNISQTGPTCRTFTGAQETRETEGGSTTAIVSEGLTTRELEGFLATSLGPEVEYNRGIAAGSGTAVISVLLSGRNEATDTVDNAARRKRKLKELLAICSNIAGEAIDKRRSESTIVAKVPPLQEYVKGLDGVAARCRGKLSAFDLLISLKLGDSIQNLRERIDELLRVMNVATAVTLGSQYEAVWQIVVSLTQCPVVIGRRGYYVRRSCTFLVVGLSP